MKTIGLFGITANPAHLGHLEVIKEASKNIDEVWVSPVWVHPFGKKFIDYNLRKKMLIDMINEFNLTNVFVKDLDKDFFELKNETVYSYFLLKHLKENYNYNFKLIIGEDNYKIFDRFKYSKEIIEEFGLIIIEDKGHHSTDIRNMIINNEDISNFVPISVLNIINEYNLYKEVL